MGALGMGHFFAHFIFDCRRSFRDSMADIIAACGHRSQLDSSHIAGDVANVYKPQADCSHVAGDAADGR